MDNVSKHNDNTADSLEEEDVHLSENESKSIYEAAWESVKIALRRKLGTAVYDSWFGKVRFVRVNLLPHQNKCIVLESPTKFIKSFIENRYLDQLELIWKKVDPKVSDVLFQVAHRPSVNQASLFDEGGANNGANDPIGNSSNTKLLDSSSSTRNTKRNALHKLSSYTSTEADSAHQTHRQTLYAIDDDLCTPLDPKLTFESFVIGAQNELAAAAAKRLSTTEQASFNPLFFYSLVGLGKTHLMQAAAHFVRQMYPQKIIVYLSAEKFMYHFVQALKNREMMEFKKRLRAVDILMVEDIQFISGKETTQDEFFQTFNALIDQGRQIVLSADRLPKDFDDMGERIKSRLNGGLVADIQPYDDSMRLSILQRKQKLNLIGDGMRLLDDSVLSFLAQAVTSSVRELESATRKVAAYAELSGSMMSVPLAQHVLKDILKKEEKNITVCVIQEKVADYYHIHQKDLLSVRRNQSLALARHVAMYLSKKITKKSLPEIGREFGGRNHATVIHAIKRIENLKTKEYSVESAICDIERMVIE